MTALVDRLGALARDIAHDGAAPSVERLAGGASTRTYHRIRAGAFSCIAMVLPADALGSEEATGKETPAELPFLNVQRYLALAGTPVPAVLRLALDEGILLLEDLGDTTLELALATAPAERLYGMAIDTLADLRAHAEAHPDPRCVAFQRSFDEGLYRWELDHYLEFGLVARTGAPPSAAERSILADSFQRIAAHLGGLPRSFTHRDYQSRNLMLAPRGLVVIDFQDALRGPRQYDLVALLRDSYVELSDALVDALLARYLERLEGLTGERIDADEFRRGFDLLTVQRKLKDGGRFEFIARVKGNPGFLPHVPASFRYVARALERLPDHGDLLRLLRDRHPEMREPATARTE